MIRGRVDWSAVAVGAAVGLVVLVLVGLAASVADGDDDPALILAVPLLVVALGGLGAAGWIATSRASRAPLVHASVAALAAVAVAEVFVVARQLATDEPIAWATAGAWLLLALATGLMGGRWALRPHRRADSGR